MQARTIALIVAVLVFSCNRNTSQSAPSASPEKGMVVAFYNVENLFDTEDQPNKIDEDFTPEGQYKWTVAKYQQKLTNIAQVISSIGDSGPAIIGLAEVENRKVLEDLVAQPSLKNRNYQILHEESPDMRGIDNALLYDPTFFQYISHEAYEMSFPEEADYTSRLVLWVTGKIKGESIHLVVNHWPSRSGGQLESEGRRIAVAQQVRKQVDERLDKDPLANILLMGDFNDDPFNKSLVEELGATSDWLGESVHLYNPMFLMHQPDSVGTLTYRGKWNLFDMFLISKGLLDKKGKLSYLNESAAIFHPEFMQVGGDSPSKDMPRRAIYRGEFQANGYADHFPVYVRLQY